MASVCPTNGSRGGISDREERFENSSDLASEGGSSVGSYFGMFFVRSCTLASGSDVGTTPPKGGHTRGRVVLVIAVFNTTCTMLGIVKLTLRGIVP